MGRLLGSRKIWQLGYYVAALGLVVGLSLVAPAQPPSPPPTAGAPAAAPTTTPLDQPLAWMAEARRNYTAVRDYSCTMLKRERVRGVLQDENIIALSCKTQPFSIYMKWYSPAKFRGQEVCYVQGKNNGMMRVQSKGLLGGITGFVNIAANDKRVMEHSRHTIHEAGIGNLIEQCSKIMEAERRLNRTQVRTGEFMFNNRHCLRIETLRPERNDQYYCYRSVLYLDKDSKLPVRMENYDWPIQGGSPDGDLLEMFSFVDLRFNAGITDDFFTK
jgi:hypothetical protein